MISSMLGSATSVDIDAQSNFVGVSLSPYALEFFENLVVACPLFLNQLPELGIL